jgi:hypothetical protein
MNDLNLRREKKTNPVKTLVKETRQVNHSPEKEYPAITSLQCEKYQLTATLSDGRIISIPIA